VVDLKGFLADYGEMSAIESAIGEEYSVRIYAKAVEAMGGASSAPVSDLLLMISEDEERHVRLLSAIRDRVAASGQGGRQRGSASGR